MTNAPAREYVAIDLETTGLSPRTDRIVEVGAVRFDASGAELGRFQSLVDPERPMSPHAERIHGISNAMLAGQPRAAVVLPGLVEFLGDPQSTTLLAHNASFDAGFLGRELARIGLTIPRREIVDTLLLARRLLPGAVNHRLDTLARMRDLDPDGPHRALADSLRVKGLWMSLTGGSTPDVPLVSYPIVDARGRPAPTGWEVLDEAIERGARVRVEYAAGTRGSAPREITPLRFVHRGGETLVVALCHIDRTEKRFRLGMIVRFEVMEAATVG